ncbi:MAG: 4-(cytidine 5'-diphospho)-2-C-methyl-D-erythritol kinase [Clostridia bacterium]|nr:4-(cytidine 5'-diphospho)-2-C-methyl-D-erythritol kinase [Clostridia bacterium]
MRIEARAKINWTLDIVGQREDGYHLMDMLMQPVTLADVVTLTPADTITLTTGGTPLLPADAKNLACRAAAALKAHTGYPSGAAIHVEKRIPVGAGMGGGSSDAAAVLAGLNRLWGTGLNQAELEAIGLTLGADVPFCLRGGLTRTTGIGERMADLPCGKAWPLVCIQPCEGLSTKEIFAAYHESAVHHRPDNDAASAALALGDGLGLAAAMANVMQPVSEQRRPDISDAIRALEELGAFAARMTGSGSAVFGVFEDASAADAACAALRARWERTFRCDTCMESLVIHDEP